MLSDHNAKYSDRMEISYKAFAVTFELRFPFPLRTVLDWVPAPAASHVVAAEPVYAYASSPEWLTQTTYTYINTGRAREQLLP